MLDIQEIGNRLKLLRIKAELSQEELAEKCETSQNIISRMELGEGGSMKVFLTMITFYKTLYNIDNFLADDFTVESIKDNTQAKILKSLTLQKIQLLKEESDRIYSEVFKILAM